MRAEVLYRPPTEALRFLPEGPYPLDADRISWVAIQHGPESQKGSLNLLNLTTGINESYELPGRPGFAFATSQAGIFVVGCERELGLFSTLDRSWTPFCTGIDSAVSGTIINDAVVFGKHLVFGCKDLKFETRKAGLYLWNGEQKKLYQLRNDQICSNGKAIRQRSNGEYQLIDIDTPTKQVAGYTIDFEKGTLGTREVLVDLTQQVGFPDGAILTPDEQAIIISIYNPDPAPAGETRLYDLTSGELKYVWQTPGVPKRHALNW